MRSIFFIKLTICPGSLHKITIKHQGFGLKTTNVTKVLSLPIAQNIHYFVPLCFKTYTQNITGNAR